MLIDLSHKGNFNDIYLPLFNSDKRFRILYGGRDSGKSDFVAQWMIIHMLTDGFFRGILVRKYERSIKGTQFQTIVDYINMWNLRGFFKINHNPIEITCKLNGNFIRARGLDNPDSALSIKDPNCFWYEEADQITKEAFLQTSASARTSLTDNIYEWFTFNPRKKMSWINDYFFPAEATYENDEGNFHYVPSIDPDTIILHTTYKDNKYCKPNRRRRLESFKNYDLNYYRVNTLGLWGGALKGLIYPHYKLIKKFPDVDHIWSLDYGYNNPTAIVKVGYAQPNQLYAKEYFYRTAFDHGAIADFIIKNFKDEIGANLFIVDSAEPALISSLRSAGINATPSVKKSDSIKTVYDGIMYTKEYNLNITEDSDNLVKEIEGYSWKIDKDGKVYDEPVKLEDHLMDAVRYAVQTYGIKYWRKSTNSQALSAKPRIKKQDKFKGF